MNATIIATPTNSPPPSFLPTTAPTAGKEQQRGRHKPLPDWSTAPWAAVVPTTSTTCPPTPTAAPSSFPTVSPHYLDDFLRVPTSPPYYYNSGNYGDDELDGSHPGLLAGMVAFVVVACCLGCILPKYIERREQQRITTPAATSLPATRSATPAASLPVARLAGAGAATSAQTTNNAATTTTNEVLVGGMNTQQREKHVKKSLTSVMIELSALQGTLPVPSAPTLPEGTTDEFHEEETVTVGARSAEEGEEGGNRSQHV